MGSCCKSYFSNQGAEYNITPVSPILNIFENNNINLLLQNFWLHQETFEPLPGKMSTPHQFKTRLWKFWNRQIKPIIFLLLFFLLLLRYFYSISKIESLSTESLSNRKIYKLISNHKNILEGQKATQQEEIKTNTSFPH